MYQNVSFTEKAINWTDSMKTFKDCFYLLAIFYYSVQLILSHAILKDFR